ncbi:hypothetical protein [Streptomyces sp. NPDC052042]|uniref:hypothetical protein n=1 Tax=Streptomyces sp. NPDC052042 TaxID=3365683 RepID=UPI0037D802C5
MGTPGRLDRADRFGRAAHHVVRQEVALGEADAVQSMGSTGLRTTRRQSCPNLGGSLVRVRTWIAESKVEQTPAGHPRKLGFAEVGNP